MVPSMFNSRWWKMYSLYPWKWKWGHYLSTENGGTPSGLHSRKWDIRIHPHWSSRAAPQAMNFSIITSDNAALGPHTCVFIGYVAESDRATILYTGEYLSTISSIILLNIIQPNITVQLEENNLSPQRTQERNPYTGYLVTWEDVLNPSHNRKHTRYRQSFP